ncbi:MAG: hypothetical protein GY798_01190 [Hyphomicrobiales bacterium]|nr:hypothetical protein [Hyphomicrobiales bacterium]
MPHRRNPTAAAMMISLTAFVAPTFPASAALSPFWRSASEIEAIVNDQRVHDALMGEEAIQSITTTEADVYEIRTRSCRLVVTVVDKPTDAQIMGPRQFDLEVGTARCH